MDYKLTKEQELIRSNIRKFCEKKLEPIAVETDENSRFPAEVFKELAVNGWLGMPIPEEYGGAGLDYLTYIMVLEEIARVSAAACVDISCHTGCALVINNFGNDQQKQLYLPSMAGGEKIGAFCVTEPGAGTDVSAIAATAEKDGDTYIINSTKTFITNGPIADIYLVLAYTDKAKGSRGMSLFIVPKETPGIRVGTHFAKTGLRASQTSEVILKDCRVSAENLIGAEGQGMKIGLIALNHGRIAIAAQSIGIAQAAMEESIIYAKERVQFGKPLASQQAIQWMLAEMATDIAAARHLAYHAACLKDSGKPFAQEASMAKLFASTMVNRHVFKAVQIHGGNGYVRGIKVERLSRDARATEIYEGTTEAQHMIIARNLLA
jgi:butyryl-CoA dehydrogenase